MGENVAGYISKDGTRAEGTLKGVPRGFTTGKSTENPGGAVPEEVANPGTSTERYQYKPVSQPDGIRCLVLEGATGAADEPLICRLHHHRLADEPDFEAISYVWGSSQKTHTIICDGQQLAITKNLHTVLLQARLPSQERTLWADAICIDQGDLKEKNHQVTMMSRIYGRARRVLICLGPDANSHAKDTADLVSDVRQWVRATVASTGGSRGSYRFMDQSQWPITDPRWAGLCFMTGLDWFQRGWVVQEAGLARDAQVLWGEMSMNWIDILRALLWAGVQSSHTLHPRLLYSMRVVHMKAYLTNCPEEVLVLNGKSTLRFLELLDLSEDLEFEDERDRIYAFLGLSGAARLEAGFEIDYKLPYRQVYFRFASWYINTTQDLRILGYVHHEHDSLLADVPSWVPQWHIRPRPMSLQWEYKSIISGSKVPDRASLAAIQGNVLTVHGLLIDRILGTSQMLHSETTIDEVAELWAGLEQHSMESAYQKIPPLLAFCYAIRAGRWLLPDHVQAMHDSEYMLRLHNKKALPSHPGLDAFRGGLWARSQCDASLAHDLTATWSSGRRVVTTVRGHYGLVPGLSRAHDLICMISGTHNPYIIREFGRKGHYKFLGEAVLVSARPTPDIYPYKVGRGPISYEDWVEWDLEEQEINLV